MAVGPGTLPEFFPVAGVRLGIASAGIKKPGRKDLVVFELAEGSRVAGIFTTNQFCAAPVTVARQHLAETAPRYLLINTGNANAGTGEQGMKDALRCCSALATKAGVAAAEVLPFSTGVIGESLPVDKLVAAMPAALEDLSAENWAQAAAGIMTTDTRPKGASRQLQVGDQVIAISGISKGAGMICPNMATMLGFVATDANIEAGLLQTLVAELGDQSFNRITIDSDTSTNDACMLVATGQNGGALITTDSPCLPELRAALAEVFMELAHAIVRDGEGATKFVTLDVSEAASQDEALAVAYTVAHSPLVKTALFAADPNWGRILAAVGRAGLDHLDIDAVEIYLDEVCIVRAGARAAEYTEADGQRVMDRAEYEVRVVLGRGAAREQVWTCDLSYDYVKINAEYRS